MTLDILFARACVSRYQRHLWFQGVTLVQNSLLVPDLDQMHSIERQWLSRLREVMPALVVTFATSRPQASAQPAPKQAFKKAYAGRIESNGTQGDLY